jgi:hypothetical protein
MINADCMIGPDCMISAKGGAVCPGSWTGT